MYYKRNICQECHGNVAAIRINEKEETFERRDRRKESRRYIYLSRRGKAKK